MKDRFLSSLGVLGKLAVFTLLVAGLLLSCAKGKTAAEIKIGFMGPMTGDYANYGQLQSKGIQLALDDFNAKEGGIAGKPVQLVIEDTQGNVEKGVAAAQKLINVDKIKGLVGPVFSGVTLAVTEYFEDASIPLISASATIAGLTDKGAYIFRTVPDDSLQASVLGRYIAQELNYSTMAILFTKNDYSQALAESVTEVYQQFGGNVLISLGSPEGTKDFRTQLAQAIDTKPEAIFLPNFAPESAQIIKQLSEIGVEIPIVSGDGFSTGEIFELVGELANGVVFSASPQNSSANAANFRKRYRDAFQVEPDDFSANIYDGTTILLNAIKGVYNEPDGEIDAKTLRSAIQDAKLSGVSGEIEFASNGNVKKGISIVEVKDQQFVPVGVYSVDGSGQLEQLQ